MVTIKKITHTHKLYADYTSVEMSGKSQCKRLLLDLCNGIAEKAGEFSGASFECTKDIPAAVTCCDGLVFLNRIGAVMSQPTPVGKYGDDGYEIAEDCGSYQAVREEDELFAGVDIELLVAMAANDDSKKPYGTWNHMYSGFAREVDGMFARADSKVVVLGFDKRIHVDGVKYLTHEKRVDLRQKAREKQIEKDLAAGMTPTRGIPFTYESIRGDALVPYPFSMMLHGPGHCAAIVRYICKMLINRYRPPREDQTLILDGHHILEEDMPHMFAAAESCGADVPISIRRHETGFAPWLANCVGEFDHTAFYYVHELATSEALINRYNLQMPSGMGLSAHIRTNDTDTLILGIVFLERFRELYPDALGKPLGIVMEIPHKAPVKVDCGISINRMLELITRKYNNLQYPGAYFAYGLYMKENDYDAPFMSGVGHEKFMNALVRHSNRIGDLIECARDNREISVDMDEFDISDLDDNVDDEAVSPCKKRARMEDRTITTLNVTGSDCEDDMGPTGSSIMEYHAGSSSAPDTLSAAFARKVSDKAVEKFVAACFHEATAFRTKKAQLEREKLIANGKEEQLDEVAYTYEFVQKACRKRKKSGVTQMQVEEKIKRHNYFIALCEELMFDRPRSLSFEDADEHGYASYRRNRG